ncbi:hypothetical protein ACQUFY_27690 (plasmid) [Robbsia andropogonis]|uniref:hypothetical protein n=1 Tax=Robbsia andropogonis TaxID=28092 RepID=UPI003D21E38D
MENAPYLEKPYTSIQPSRTSSAADVQRSPQMAGQGQQYFSNFTKSGTSTLLNV